MGGYSSAKHQAAVLKEIYEALKLAEADTSKNCHHIPEILKYGQPYNSGITFHTYISIVSGVATILCILISCFLALGHLSNYTNPPEQKQLLRIIFILPIFAICSFFGCLFYTASPFLEPIPQIFEAFGIVALFYFYVNCVTPNEDYRDAFYDGLERQKRFHKQKKRDNGSLRWFHVIWIGVFQLLLGRVGTTVAYEWNEATKCPLSKNLHRNTSIIRAIQGIQVLIAVVAVIFYAHRMRPHLQGRRPFSKLFSFKGIVILESIQVIVFGFLAASTIFKPTYNISYFDFSVGVPAFMLCCEMFIFSVLFIWSFSFAPYRKLAKDGHRKFGFFRGMWDVINIMDILYGVWYLFKALAPRNFGKQYVQKGGDATMVEGRVQDAQRGALASDSEPDSLQKVYPVQPGEKV